MPELTDRIDPNASIPHRERPSARDGIDSNEPVPQLSTLELTWAVLDLATLDVAEFAAEGGHFESLAGHRYLVFLRAVDPRGVQILTLDGSGMFRCSTDPDRDGIFHEAALPFPASIPHQQFVNTGVAPTLQSLIAVMKPDLGAFDYFRLSCGFHHLNGTSGNLEYFAFSGLMTFSATASSSQRERRSASLTTAP